MPVTPPDVIVGVPADLIRRRPDVRRAERQVRLRSARIGVAVSDLYPHISLLGMIGVEAEQFGDLFKTPGSMIGEIGPGVRWDILNYGRLVNNVRVQDARFQALAYAYQNQVLNAGREVEDAMVVFLRSQEQAQHLDASVDAAARTVEITKEQYTQGEVDFTPVFLFESTLTEQQDQLAVVARRHRAGLDCRLSRAGRRLADSPERRQHRGRADRSRDAGGNAASGGRGIRHPIPVVCHRVGYLKPADPPASALWFQPGFLGATGRSQ